jgi:molybdopterin-guanine dinucleotide biosynthesis protein A
MRAMKVGGIVVCGGKSSRMGRPKEWLPIDGEPMLARVVRILSSVVEPMVVVAAIDQDLPMLPRAVRIVRDERPDCGPLEGIAAGLKSIDSEIAYLSASDVPLLRSEFVRAVIDRIAKGDTAVPYFGGRFYPLSAVVRVDPARVAARRLLDGNRRAARFLFEELDSVVRLEESELRAVDPDLLSLRNANTPEDYDGLLRIISAASVSDRAGP